MGSFDKPASWCYAHKEMTSNVFIPKGFFPSPDVILKDKIEAHTVEI